MSPLKIVGEKLPPSQRSSLEIKKKIQIDIRCKSDVFQFLTTMAKTGEVKATFKSTEGWKGVRVGGGGGRGSELVLN